MQRWMKPFLITLRKFEVIDENASVKLDRKKVAAAESWENLLQCEIWNVGMHKWAILPQSTKINNHIQRKYSGDYGTDIWYHKNTKTRIGTELETINRFWENIGVELV